jgi:cytosine/adenosine deaminase-related metal-dependent hydrolase
MHYRKIWADIVFDGYCFLKEQVLIISKDGTVQALVPLKDAGENVERYHGLLAPGFVNCHCHLELSHLRGRIPERTGLVDFVFKVVNERTVGEEEVLEAIASAEKEMKSNGIVAIGDICNNTLTLSQKEQGNLQYYNFIEASGWLPAVSGARFQKAKQVYEEYKRSHESGVRTQEGSLDADRQLPTDNLSIVPHAPYSVSENLWKEIQPYFQNKIVSIHNQETHFEDEFFQQGTGDFLRMYNLMNLDNSHYQATKKSSLQSYFDKLQGSRKIILVHNTFTKQEDINYVNRQSVTGNKEPGMTQPATLKSKPQTFFCLCPNANLYIEGAPPPIELLRKNNCTIVLGTDSLASNRSLDILGEIRTLNRLIAQSGQVVPLEEMLGWATINGARALGMETQFGSFEKGKKPGAVLISAESLEVEKVLF